MQTEKNAFSLMTILLSSFTGPAISGSILIYNIAGSHLDVASEILNKIPHDHRYNFLLYIVIAITGLIYKGAGKRESKMYNFIKDKGYIVANMYSSTSGSIFGIILGYCAAAIFSDPIKYLPLSAMVFLFSFLIFITPIFSYLLANETIDSFNNKIFYKKWHALILRQSGNILFFTATILFIHDIYHLI